MGQWKSSESLETNRIPKVSKDSNDETKAHEPKTDSSNPSNHRPIALTRCICKGSMTGQRGITDYLIRLKTFIREAFIKEEHLIAISFDLEKVYDTTWK